MNDDCKTKPQLSRREFVKKAALGSTFLIVPRHVLGGPAYVAPSDKINIGVVGAGGRGRSNVEACSHESIYSICDIDANEISGTLNQDWASSFRDQAKIYRDYRECLKKNLR